MPGPPRLVPLALAALAVAAPARAERGSAFRLSRGTYHPQTPGRHLRYLPDWERHPATRYAAMSGEACTAELTRRGVAFARVEEAPGVVTPLRLPRGVGGVLYRTDAPANIREVSPFDVFDCRLVLALSDFSKVLRVHDVDEVRIFSAYRPAPHRARQAGSTEEGTRHAGGLAVDARRFRKRVGDGYVWLDVERDFHGTLGAASCGPGAAPPRPATPEARELRSIVCEAADQHLFTSILTPGYDRAHRNHFHLEVTPGARWSLVR